MIFGMQMTTLLSWSSGLSVAIFTFLFIAIGSTFFTYKADRYMANLLDAPVLV